MNTPLLAGLARYLRTAAHLRWSQWFWRARYSIERRRRVRPTRWQWPEHQPPAVRADFPAVPAARLLKPSEASQARHSSRAAAGPEAFALLQQGLIRHLNQTKDIGSKVPDWHLGAVTHDRLWTIHLHYHAWLVDLAEEAAGHGAENQQAASLFQFLVNDWMERCGLSVPGSRSLAWNAYAVATRITSWIRAYQILGSDYWRRHADFAKDFLGSLWQQAAYLRDHLEWDLLANHLLRDAVGLSWAGRFFAEDRAREWLATATNLARGQLDEQVLADGGHFERSPMYHLHVMEDMLSLTVLMEDEEARARLKSRWRDMAEYLAWLRHPDGNIALFNDAALNGACEPNQMLGLGTFLGFDTDVRPRRGARYFPHAGMVAWHGTPWTVFFDVGPVGPDYQPGHAHADTLSMECSFMGRRLFVNPGTYGYDHDARRHYDRSTAAHNTVCIDQQDSSEVWHIFRVGRRAYPCDVEAKSSEDGIDVTASHSGYDHLAGRPRHRRRLMGTQNGPLAILDRVEGGGRHVMEGGFLLAPDWQATPSGSGWLLRNDVCSVQLQVKGPPALQLTQERRPYHPEFGQETETTRLCWRLETALPMEVKVFAVQLRDCDDGS